MKLSKINTVSLLTRLAGLSAMVADSSFQTSVTAIAGHKAPIILGGLGLLSFFATDVLHAIQLSKTPGVSVPTQIGAIASEIASVAAVLESPKVAHIAEEVSKTTTTLNTIVSGPKQ